MKSIWGILWLEVGKFKKKTVENYFKIGRIDYDDKNYWKKIRKNKIVKE